MSLNAATIEVLLAKGLTAGDLLEVARALEKRRDNTNAERQARHRAKRKSNGRYSNGVTPPNDIDILTPGSEASASSPKTGFVLPSDIPADPWAAFERMRAKIKKPMTDDARWLAVGRLRKLRDEDGWPPGDVLNHCTLNSYQGIYPPTKAKRNDSPGKSAAAFAMLNPGDEPF